MAVTKVAGVKVYQRQTWNFRFHAVSACIGLWHHRPMHAPHRLMHACYWRHCPITSQVDACSYCMGSVVLILSRIYLYLQLLWAVTATSYSHYCTCLGLLWLCITKWNHLCIYIKMLSIFSNPVLIRHQWQLKTVVFLHWCLICIGI